MFHVKHEKSSINNYKNSIKIKSESVSRETLDIFYQ